MTKIKSRIKNKGQRIRVQTTLGTSVTITKKEAYRLLDKLEQRDVEPKVEFVEVGNGRELVLISTA